MIDLVRTDAGLLALRAEWDRLWREMPDACPFQSPAWLLPWWEAFGTGAPVVAVLRRHGAMRGILPLYRLDGRLLMMGAGTTDYLDALMAPEEDVAPLLNAALAFDCGRCELPDLPPGASLRRIAGAEAWQGAPCPVLALDAGLSAVPKGMKRDVRQARNRAERAGGFVIRRASATDWRELFDTLVRLHAARWEARGEGGVLADPAVLRHHRNALPALLRDGLARLWAIVLNGEVAAVIYALLSARNRIFFYLSGFDAGRAFESPGTILLAAMLEAAAAEGRREAHFLRGGEAYKYAWGAIDRLNIGLRVGFGPPLS